MDFPGDLTCLLPLLSMGKHMLAHELADRAAYHFVGFLKVAGVEVHCCLLHRAFLLFGFVVAFRRFWRKSPGRGGPDREPLGLETEFSLAGFSKPSKRLVFLCGQIAVTGNLP